MLRFLLPAALAAPLAAGARADEAGLVATKDLTRYEHSGQDLRDGEGEPMFVVRTDLSPGAEQDSSTRSRTQLANDVQAEVDDPDSNHGTGPGSEPLGGFATYARRS